MTITIPALTPRERQVLTMTAEGGTDAGIAADLGIFASTVQRHQARIREKLGAENRANAVWIAVQAGFLPYTKARG